MLDSVAKFREILSQKYLTLHSMKENQVYFVGHNKRETK